MKEKYPQLLQYDGNWVVSDFLKIYLKNSAGYIGVQCIISIAKVYCLLTIVAPHVMLCLSFVLHFKCFRLSLTAPLLSACSCSMFSKLLLFWLGDIQCLSTLAFAFVLATPVRLCQQWHHPCCTPCFKLHHSSPLLFAYILINFLLCVNLKFVTLTLYAVTTISYIYLQLHHWVEAGLTCRKCHSWNAWWNNPKGNSVNCALGNQSRKENWPIALAVGSGDVLTGCCGEKPRELNWSSLAGTCSLLYYY